MRIPERDVTYVVLMFTYVRLLTSTDGTTSQNVYNTRNVPPIYHLPAIPGAYLRLLPLSILAL